MVIVNKTRFTNKSVADFLRRVLWWHKEVFPKVPRRVQRTLVVIFEYNKSAKKETCNGEVIRDTNCMTVRIPHDHKLIDMPSLAWLFSHELLHIQGVLHEDMGNAMRHWGHTINTYLWEWAKTNKLEEKQ